MMFNMRTTLTIDDDLFDLVRQEAAQTRRQFKEVLNERLRLGYANSNAKRRKHSRFKVKPFRGGGFAPGIDQRKLNQLLDALDIESHKR
jgi:hypothetical protein